MTFVPLCTYEKIYKKNDIYFIGRGLDYALAAEGALKLKEISYSVMFDRIEAGTYLIAGAITQGSLRIQNINPDIIKTEIKILEQK